LQVAIEHALTVLSWYEHLPKDEVPPEYLWEDAQGLEQWWATVEAKRDSGMPTSRGRDIERAEEGDDDGDPGPSMAENDYARSLKQG
jgi:hypothetical protein